jgi:uncharacterized membrane protein (UPF0127 family)
MNQPDRPRQLPTIMFNIIIGTIGLIVLISYLSSIKAIPTLSEYLKIDETGKFLNISIASTTIKAMVATSSVDLQTGLGNRPSLPQDQGMLFVFPRMDFHGIWMLNMAFPIDVVWIDEDKEIVGLTKNIDPKTYPAIFMSPKPVKYILELNSGFIDKNNIATGTLATFVM